MDSSSEKKKVGEWEMKTTKDEENIVAEKELRIDLGKYKEGRIALTRNALDEKS